MSTIQKFSRKYGGNKPYEIVEDSIQLPKLPTGVYLLEYSSSSAGIKPQYELYYVTDIFLMNEEQPNNKIRYVVVNSTTGQPIANANIKLSFAPRYGVRKSAKILTTNKNGRRSIPMTNIAQTMSLPLRTKTKPVQVQVYGQALTMVMMSDFRIFATCLPTEAFIVRGKPFTLLSSFIPRTQKIGNQGKSQSYRYLATSRCQL